MIRGYLFLALVILNTISSVYSEVDEETDLSENVIAEKASKSTSTKKTNDSESTKTTAGPSSQEDTAKCNDVCVKQLKTKRGVCITLRENEVNDQNGTWCQLPLFCVCSYQ